MRRRILLVLIVMTTTATLALFVPASIALRNADRTDQNLELQNETLVAVNEFLSTGAITPVGGHDFAIYGTDDRLLQGNGPAAADQAVQAAKSGRPTVRRTHGAVIAAVPITGARVLRVAETQGALNRKLVWAVTELGLVALAIIALAAFVAVRLSRRMNRPLAALAESAHQLGDGDFTERAATSGLAEIDEVSAALNSAASRLETLMSRERALTEETSHQLRTPLAGMRVAVEAEVASPRDDPSVVLVELLAAIDRMDGAITNLITLGRDRTPDRRPVAIADLVRDAAQRWTPQFRSGQRRIVVDAASIDALATTARPAAIEAVLDVLLDNALVHGRGDVSMSTRSDDGAPVVSVTDRGRFAGDDAVDPFRRPVHHGDRHGRGLAMARTLVEAEHGRIALVNADPTTFEIVLPVPPVHEPTPTPTTPPRRRLVGGTQRTP